MHASSRPRMQRTSRRSSSSGSSCSSKCMHKRASKHWLGSLHELQACMQPSCITVLQAIVHERSLALIMRACWQARRPTDTSTGHTLFLAPPASGRPVALVRRLCSRRRAPAACGPPERCAARKGNLTGKTGWIADCSARRAQCRVKQVWAHRAWKLARGVIANPGCQGAAFLRGALQGAAS